MKEYTLNDATKEELIQYFFGVDTIGGGFDKERFLIWLARKRTGELMDVIGDIL